MSCLAIIFLKKTFSLTKLVCLANFYFCTEFFFGGFVFCFYPWWNHCFGFVLLCFCELFAQETDALLVYAVSENKISAELFQSAWLFFTSFLKKIYFLLPSIGVFRKSFVSFFFFSSFLGPCFFFLRFGWGVHYGAGKDLSFLISFLRFHIRILFSSFLRRRRRRKKPLVVCLFAVWKISDVFGFYSF